MQDWRAKHLDIPELQRKGQYNQLSFTIELIRELAGITDYAIAPIYSVPKTILRHSLISNIIVSDVIGCNTKR